MSDQLSKEYFVTLEVPVQVTCSVRAKTIVEAMAAVWIAYRGSAA